jgi:hypothetical protein
MMLSGISASRSVLIDSTEHFPSGRTVEPADHTAHYRGHLPPPGLAKTETAKDVKVAFRFRPLETHSHESADSQKVFSTAEA